MNKITILAFVLVFGLFSQLPVNGKILTDSEEKDRDESYKPSVFTDGYESEGSVLSSFSNFVLNLIEKAVVGSVDDSGNDQSIKLEYNDWSVNENMGQIFDSLSKMWKQNVGQHFERIKTFFNRNESLVNIRETYEQYLIQMNDLENNLTNLWRETTTIVLKDNQTLNDSVLKSEFMQKLSDNFDKLLTQVKSVWDKYNNESSSYSERLSQSFTDWKQRVQSFISENNYNQFQTSMIEIRQQLNELWQSMANRMKSTIDSNLESIDCKDCINTDYEVFHKEEEEFGESLDRMDRIQRDVQQLWQTINSEENTEKVDENSIQDRIHSVFNNINNFYSSKANGSRVEGAFESAADRVSRVGTYFKNLWQTGSQHLHNTRVNITESLQKRRENVSSMLRNLSESIKTRFGSFIGKNDDNK